MQDDQQQTTITSDEAVGFPTPTQKKKGGSLKWIIILVLILIVAGVAAFFLLQNSTQSIEPQATPEVSGVETQSETPEPQPTPEPVDKTQISIQVLNGTGLSGEANYLETQLKNLGYSKIDKGNAPSQNATKTTITLASSVPQSVEDEILAKLGELYSQVETASGSTGAGIDIKIVTGLRKGVTPKPTAKPTTAASSTPKASGTPTSSPSASPKPTATP